ncbi:MAG: histidine kinase [Bacteroidota bacterium]
MLRITLFWALLLFLTLSLEAQAPSKKMKRAKLPTATLEQAIELRKEDPAAAIRTLNALIQQQESPDDLADAFLLLGDIYVDIDQQELALGRYARAAEVMSADDQVRRAALAYRRGRVLLRQGELDDAREAFNSCLSMTKAGDAQNILCREGLADLEARSENYLESQAYYGQVKEQALDSLTQLRINVKQADVYLQQNDLSNAANSLNEALQQAPRKEELPAAEADDLLAANTKLRSAVVRDAPDLDVSVVDALPSAPAALVISDEFARFRALRDKGDMARARIVLERTLERVDEATPPEIATDVYAEGATFYLENQEPLVAADIYQNYASASDQLFAARQTEIDQQVAVLREQQNVDLGLKDLRAKAVEGELRAEQNNLQLRLNYLLGALLLGALISVFLILKNVRKRRRTNQELLLRNLQTRMNPHFIFNSLNSINNYIARQDERSANRYLGRFAKLMRRVLDQSGKDFVPLAEELEQLGLYLELEKERFGGKFDYLIEVAEDLPTAPENVELPPMILQPFVENAIWHGLRYRETGGELSIKVVNQAGRVRVRVVDNGIGREKSAALKTDNQRRHRSAGISTSQQRLALVNEHYGRDFKLKVTDAYPEAAFVGTKVEIIL